MWPQCNGVLDCGLSLWPLRDIRIGLVRLANRAGRAIFQGEAGPDPLALFAAISKLCLGVIPSAVLDFAGKAAQMILWLVGAPRLNSAGEYTSR